MIDDLNGRECKQQPEVNEYPVLLPGEFNGCVYSRTTSGDSSVSNESGLPSFDTEKLYDQARAETVHVDLTASDGKHQMAGSGSGVIIGESGDRLLIATDNHVANPQLPGGSKLTDRSVTMADGSEHEARVELIDRAHDLAVLSVDARTLEPGTYRVASLADTPPNTGSGAVFGFPKNSKSLYASPARFDGQMAAGRLYRRDERLPGEDVTRDLLLLKAHTEEGESGAPTYNSSRQVVGLLEGGPTKGTAVGQLSYVNPLSRMQVRAWLHEIEAGREG